MDQASREMLDGILAQEPAALTDADGFAPKVHLAPKVGGLHQKS